MTVQDHSQENNKDRSQRDIQPAQLVHRLWKKYEHLDTVVRRVRIAEELRGYGLPDENISRLLRDYT
jgi:hypothetical protein